MNKDLEEELRKNQEAIKQAEKELDFESILKEADELKKIDFSQPNAHYTLLVYATNRIEQRYVSLHSKLVEESEEPKKDKIAKYLADIEFFTILIRYISVKKGYSDGMYKGHDPLKLIGIYGDKVKRFLEFIGYENKELTKIK